MAPSGIDPERAGDERLRHGGSGGYGADREAEDTDETGSAAPDPEEDELADEDEQGFPRGAEA
jgi:hypothetical protein